MSDKDGKTVWQEWIDTPLFDDRGKLTEFQSTGRDITSARQLTKAEAEKSRLFNRLIGLTSEGFWQVNTDRQLVDVNAQACAMLGYTREEMLKMSIADIEAMETPAQIQDHTEKILESGYEIFETRHRKKDGTVIDVEVRVASWQEDGGMVLISFLKDITEQKKLGQLQQELRISQRTDLIRKHFFSQITHELMTPLNPILGFSRMLSDHPDLPLEQKKQAEIITAGAARLEKTLKNYISAGRLAIADRESFFVRFDLLALIEHLAKQFLPRYDAGGIPLDFIMAATFPGQVTGDEEKTRLLLENLLEFSLASSGPGGVVVTIGRPDFSQPHETFDSPMIQMVVTVEHRGREMEEAMLRRLSHPCDMTALISRDSREKAFCISQLNADLLKGKLETGNYPEKCGYVKLTLPLAYADGFRDISLEKMAERITGFARIADTAAAPSDQQIAALPEYLRLRLRQALAEGNMVRFVQLLDDVQSLSLQTTQGLIKLAESFDYKRLGHLLGKKEDTDD